MCEPTTIALIATAAAGTMSAAASYQQGQVAKQVGQNNATMAEYAAQDAQRRGEEAAMEVQRKGAALKSSQRVAMAAKGLDLGSGTAADLQDQTDFFTQGDVNTTRFNAARDAWSARAEGQQALAMGRAEARNSNLQAFSTLLGTAGSVAGKWDSYRKPPTTGLPDWYTNPSNTRYRGGPIGSWYGPR